MGVLGVCQLLAQCTQSSALAGDRPNHPASLEHLAEHIWLKDRGEAAEE